MPELSPKLMKVADDLFEFLSPEPFFGTLQELADAVGHRRYDVSRVRSATRSAEWVSEYKWEIGYVGIGSASGRWEIVDLCNPENAERSLAHRWPEVAEDCRRLAVGAELAKDGEAMEAELQRLVAQEQTAKAMAALAEMFYK